MAFDNMNMNSYRCSEKQFPAGNSNRLFFFHIDQPLESNGANKFPLMLSNLECLMATLPNCMGVKKMFHLYKRLCVAHKWFGKS